MVGPPALAGDLSARAAALLLFALVGCTGESGNGYDGATDPTDGAAADGMSTDATWLTDETLCQQVCAKGALLGCQPKVTIDCVMGCQRLIDMCGAAGRSFNQCALDQPIENWMCSDPVGLPTPKQSVCIAEDQAVARCLAAAR